MSDLRNKIIHHYFGIDYDIVWDVVITDIPELKEQIVLIIESNNTSQPIICETKLKLDLLN